MTVRRESDLEDGLRSALTSLAPVPSVALLQRTLDAVAGTPQTLPPSRSAMRWRTAAIWAVTYLVVVAGIVAGIAIGTSARAQVADGPGSSGVIPSGASSVPARTTGPSTPASAAEAVPAGTWERVDLPDPAPGVFAGTRASDVVAFNGGYVAVGSFAANCASDIYETPPGCAEALDALPTTQSGLVWLSEDARSWELVPRVAALEGASMEHAATDGTIIVVSGFLSQPGERIPTVWISGDGRTWQSVGSSEFLPEQLVWTAAGFIGSRPTDDGPQFVASDDGRSWRPLSEPGEHGPGEVMAMSVGLDGTTIVAVGVTYDYSDGASELLTITSTSWLSRDGQTWERGDGDEGQKGAWMSAAAEGDAGWVAVGLDQTTQAGPSETAIWTSADGLGWTRVESASVPITPYGSADEIVWTGEQFVATGTVGGETGSVIAFWLSRDGTSWEAVADQPALEDGTPDRLIAPEGQSLAVGVRSTAPDHWIGVVWIAGP